MLPQAPDVDIHRPRRDEALLAPNLFQKLVAAVGAAGMSKKEFQQIELGGRKRELDIGVKYTARLAIEDAHASPPVALVG